MNLADILPTSADTALTQPQLAAKLYGTTEHEGVDSQVNRRRSSAIRKVQEHIAALRDIGVPVVADERGVWVAQTSQEAILAYRSLRSRALGQLRRAAAVKRTAFRMQRAEAHVETMSLWDVA
ncbi:MAG: hypothetical protein ABIS21_08315 [Acidimicrobiales bacterium]